MLRNDSCLQETKKILIIVRVAEIFMKKSKYIIILEALVEKKIEGEGSLVVREQRLVGKEVTRNVFDVYTIVVNTEV